MGNVIAIFVDGPCSDESDWIQVLCDLFPNEEQAARFGANLFATWASLAYVVPIVMCWAPVWCLPSYEQYRRGANYFVFMIILFLHNFSVMVTASDPDDFFMRCYIIMGTYVACDTALMGAYFDESYLEGLISLGLLGVCIFQYFFVFSYGARPWAYLILPGAVGAFSALQRWHVTVNTNRLVKMDKYGTPMHDMREVSQLGLLTLMLMAAITGVMVSLLSFHEDRNLFAFFIIYSALAIAVCIHVLRNPRGSVSAEYRSNGGLNAIFSTPHQSKRQEWDHMMHDAGIATNNTLVINR
jgi:hypothetical protein